MSEHGHPVQPEVPDMPGQPVEPDVPFELPPDEGDLPMTLPPKAGQHSETARVLQR